MLRRTAPAVMAAPAFVPLRKIPTQRSWDFAEPTLIRAGRYTQREEWAVDDGDVVDHFKRTYPALQGLMRAGDLTLKGGAVASALMGKAPSDLDLYVAGTESVEDAQARVRAMLEAAVDVTVTRALAEERDRIDAHQRVANGQFAFANNGSGGAADGRRATKKDMVPLTSEEIEQRLHAAKTRALSNLYGMRRGGVVTVVGIPGVGVPLQLSLRPYGSVEALVEDGDVDAGAIGMNDERGLMISNRGAFAIQNWAVRAVDPNGDASRSLTATRLVNYFERGFDVILPGFNTAAVRPPISRVRTPTCFELCDGQLFVETDLTDAAEPRLTNRIQVLSMTKTRGLTGANAETAATASAPDGESESSVPEALFERVAAAASATAPGADSRQSANLRRQLQRHAVKSVRHNVRELLRGGRRFHTLLSGARITELADLRELPVTLRNVESVLHHGRKGIEADPFGAATVPRLLTLFPAVPTVEALRALLPQTASPSSADGAAAPALKRHVAATLDSLQRRQLDDASRILDACAAALAAEPLDVLLPAPPSNDATAEAFYGGPGFVTAAFRA